MGAKLLSKLQPHEMKAGLEETVERFAEQLKKAEDWQRVLHNLRVLTGDETNIISIWMNKSRNQPRYLPDLSVVAQRYRRLPNHASAIEKMIGEYMTGNVDPNRDFSATWRFDLDFAPFLFHNEQPIDNLLYLTTEYRGELWPILQHGLTSFYEAIEHTIAHVWQQALEIKEDIKKHSEIGKAHAAYMQTDQRKALRLQLSQLYLQEEARRGFQVIPLLQEMRLVYQTVIDVIRGVSDRFPKPLPEVAKAIAMYNDAGHKPQLSP